MCWLVLALNSIVETSPINLSPDNDECLSGACHDICTNFPGTFHCSCRHGYQITSDLVSCVGE